jgi:nickel-dependent lactate racemase
MNVQVAIPYDHTTVTVTIPRENIAYVSGVSNHEDLQASRWQKDEELRKHVKDKNVLLLLADATRDIPFRQIIDHLFASMGNAPKAISLCLATGTHDGENRENRAILTAARKSAVKCMTPLKTTVIHNCHTSSCFYAGTTSFGTDIFVNEIVRSADVILIHADVKNHYFAGYSNPLKYIIPGICRYQTIEQNHALTLDERSTFGHHPLHPEVNRRDNPLAQDIWEGFQLVTKNIAVYTLLTVSVGRQIIWYKSGFIPDVLPEGIRIVDKTMGLKVAPTDKLIVSCGGYPNDESLYIAQRALELTKNAITNGGEILFIAGCRNGIGPAKSIENFYNPLHGDIAMLLNTYAKQYKMYTHKVYKFAQLLDRVDGVYMHSKLTDRQIAAIHLKPVGDVQKIIDRWLSRDHRCQINIFLDGNKIAVYPQ